MAINEYLTARCPDHGDVKFDWDTLAAVIDRAEWIKPVFRFLCAVDEEHFVINDAPDRLIERLKSSDAAIFEYDSTLQPSDTTNQIEISSRSGALTECEVSDFEAYSLQAVDSAIQHTLSE